MEEKKKRKNLLAGLLVTGGVLSLFYAFCLVFYDVTPQIRSLHIYYADNFPRTLMDIAFFFYLLVTIAPLFISSVRRMWLFGILIAVSCIVTAIFFSRYLTSVWRFFAALISVAIYWILNAPKAAASSE